MEGSINKKDWTAAELLEQSIATIEQAYKSIQSLLEEEKDPRMKAALISRFEELHFDRVVFSRADIDNYILELHNNTILDTDRILNEEEEWEEQVRNGEEE